MFFIRETTPLTCPLTIALVSAVAEGTAFFTAKAAVAIKAAERKSLNIF